MEDNNIAINALRAIARNAVGLQGIVEDYAHDNNAFNYHAMIYWQRRCLTLQNRARVALEQIEQGEVDAL